MILIGEWKLDEYHKKVLGCGIYICVAFGSGIVHDNGNLFYKLEGCRIVHKAKLTAAAAF